MTESSVMEQSIPVKESHQNDVTKVACLFLHTVDGSLGSFVRVRELARSLADMGVQMQLFTPYEKNGLSNGLQITSISNLALKLNLGHLLYKLSRFSYYNGFLVKLFLNSYLQGRILDNLTTGMAKLVYANNIKVLQAEQDITLPACVRLKEITGIPIVADIHNITAEELVAAGILEYDSKGYRELQHNTASLLSSVDVVVVVSKLMKNYIESKYNVNPARVVVVPPGGRSRINHLKKKSLEPSIVYSGLVSYRENLDLFIKSMPAIKNLVPDAKFFITKKGESLGHIERLASKLNVAPEFFWYNDTELFHNFLASCHVGVLPSSEDLARKMGTPAKLFDYMSVGLPVVANDIGGWTEIISKYKVGVLTDNDPVSFANGVYEAINNREEYSENALKLVSEVYNWDNSAEILLDVYKRLAS